MKTLSFLSLLLVFAANLLFAQKKTVRTEYGIASVYSSKFEGKRTANNEKYMATKKTAAHKTLPFNTLVAVTCLDNGKTVLVRINDRGPFVENRVLDLSAAAAEALGMNLKSTSKIKMEVVSESGQKNKANNSSTVTSKGNSNTAPVPELPTQPIEYNYKVKPKTKIQSRDVPRAYSTQPNAKKVSNAEILIPKGESKNNTNKNIKKESIYYVSVDRPAVSEGNYAVQVSAVTTNENMLRQVEWLQEAGFKNTLVHFGKDKNGKALYKILLGTFDDLPSAEKYKKWLTNRKIKGVVVSL